MKFTGIRHPSLTEDTNLPNVINVHVKAIAVDMFSQHI